MFISKYNNVHRAASRRLWEETLGDMHTGALVICCYVTMPC